jgi:hypothetical protein
MRGVSGLVIWVLYMMTCLPLDGDIKPSLNAPFSSVFLPMTGHDEKTFKALKCGRVGAEKCFQGFLLYKVACKLRCGETASYCQ